MASLSSFLRSVGLLGCLLAFFIYTFEASAGEGADYDYDNEEPRKVSTVIPADLIEGDEWKVKEQVVPVEGLFRFEVETRWGDFPVYGEAMLRMRAREFRAIAELESISNTEAGVKGAGRSLKQSFTRLGNAFIHPKETARAMPQGTRRLFGKVDRYSKKIGKALKDDKAKDPNEVVVTDPSATSQSAAVWLARKYGGVGGKTRRRARDVGVDPYTSNELLAAELDRVSKAAAVGSFSTKLLLPFMAGGLGLVAASHFAVGAIGAKLGTPEVNVGLFPMMIMALLRRVMPRRRLLQMMLFGERLPAEEAAECGLLNKAVQMENLDVAVKEITDNIITKSPLTIRMGLDAWAAQEELDLAEALPILQERLMAILATEDAQEGLMAFMEKRKPVWKGK